MNAIFDFNNNSLRIQGITTDRFLINEYGRMIGIFAKNEKFISFNTIRKIFDIPWPFGECDVNKSLGNDYGWIAEDFIDVNIITSSENGSYGLIFPNLKKVSR